MNGGTHNGVDPAWTSLLALVWGAQLQALLTLKAHPKGVTAHDMVPALGVKNVNGVAGVLAGGLYKNVEKAGLRVNQVVIRQKINGVSTYKPGPLLTQHEVPAGEKS